MRHVSIWVTAFSLISILGAKADIEVINKCGSDAKRVAINIDTFLPKECRMFSVTLETKYTKIEINKKLKSCLKTITIIDSEGGPLSPEYKVTPNSKVELKKPAGGTCDVYIIKE